MNFNIKNFNIDQLHKENKYILNTYFSNLKEIEGTERNTDSYVVKDLILNDTIYNVYTYSTNKNDFEMIFIPKNLKLFSDNFDDIIKYNGSKEGLHFSILRKNNKLAEIINYDFTTNYLGDSIGNYYHDTFTDYDNRLQLEFFKQNCSLQSFLANLNVRKLIDNGYKLNRIKRNSKETKLNKIEGTSLLEAYESFDRNLEIIEDNESPIFKLLEDLNKRKVK